MHSKRFREARRAPLAAATTLDALPLLSPQLGFVVQFRSGAGLDTDVFSGRVEHLVSGRVGHFESPRQLFEFLSRVLVETQKP